MYSEAVLGTGFTDEKALLLPLALSIFVNAGGSLSQFILLQCLAGFLGARYFILSITSPIIFGLSAPLLLRETG